MSIYVFIPKNIKGFCFYLGKNVMNITQKELEAIVEVGQSTQTSEIRMNIVNIIGDIRLVTF